MTKLSSEPSTKRMLCTLQEMADDLCVSPKTLYYWVHRKEIPFLVSAHLFSSYTEALPHKFGSWEQNLCGRVVNANVRDARWRIQQSFGPAFGKFAGES